MRIIAGIFRGRTLKSPKDATIVRPTQGYIRAAVFNICQHTIGDADVLDLFAGTGAMGFEALSRGAARVTFVEKNREALECIRANAKILGVERQISIITSDVLTTLPRLSSAGKHYNLIYIDPPYALKGRSEDLESYVGDKALSIIDNSTLLAPNGSVFVEGPRSGWPEAYVTKNLALKSSRSFSESTLKHYVN